MHAADDAAEVPQVKGSMYLDVEGGTGPLKAKGRVSKLSEPGKPPRLRLDLEGSRITLVGNMPSAPWPVAVGEELVLHRHERTIGIYLERGFFLTDTDGRPRLGEGPAEFIARHLGAQIVRGPLLASVPDPDVPELAPHLTHALLFSLEGKRALLTEAWKRLETPRGTFLLSGCWQGWGEGLRRVDSGEGDRVRLIAVRP